MSKPQFAPNANQRQLIDWLKQQRAAVTGLSEFLCSRLL